MNHSMEARPFWHLSLTLTWMFVFSFPSTCSKMDTPKLFLERSVFVVLAGTGLNIQSGLEIPANYSQDSLRCYDPSHREIYEWVTPSTGNQELAMWPMLELKNLTSSGEYFCQYKTVKAYWFLRVRHHGYKDVEEPDYMLITGLLTGVLLVFSVVGSVYVFRGHWKENTSDPGNTDKKRKNNRQERNEREAKEDDMNAISSSSFYASLEPRPRSIYDVLDRSAVTTEPHQSKVKPKKKEPQETTAQTSQPQQEGVFESIYENF